MKKGLLVLAAFFSLLTFGQSVKAADWQYTSLSRGADTGQFVAIALDSNNKAHLIYVETVGGSRYLKYATNASGSFVSETVDIGSSLGLYPSIAIDYNDKAHVSYYDLTDGNLKYATNASGVWAASAIDTTDSVGAYSSIGVDSSGYVHISYFDVTNGHLKYATNSSGSGFALYTIDGGVGVGAFSSLTVDDYNYVHISYYDSTNLSLKYITNSSGSFASQTIDTGDTGLYSSIKVDNSDYVHISYYDATNQDLKYTNNMLGYWSNSTIDSAGNVGAYTSLVVDSNSRVRIGYYDADNYNFKLANNVGTSFSTTAVDNIGDAGVSPLEQPISLAMDSSNRLYAGLFDLHTSSPWDGEIMYASVTGPTSTAISIESGKKYTNFKDVDLALSAASNPIQMMVSEYESFIGAEWETYNTSRSFNLSSGSGTKTVYAKFRDQWYAESTAITDTIKYLPSPKFVTKKAKSKEILIKKKNKKYTAQKFYLKFSKLPKDLKKTKYTWQVKRYKKYSKIYSLASKNLIKQYWKITGDFNKYKSASNFKVNFVFSYTKKQFKTLKKKNKGLSEKNLVLKYYDVDKKTWHNLSATHSLKKRTFSIVLTSPVSWNQIYYAIGR